MVLVSHYSWAALCSGVIRERNTSANLIPGVFEAAFGFGWVPLPWLYTPEITPLRHRSNCAALSATISWIFNYMIFQITPVAISNISWKTYMIFFVLNIFFAAVVFLFYSETSGRTLEEMDKIFFGNNNRVFVVDKVWRLRPGFRSQPSYVDIPNNSHFHLILRILVTQTLTNTVRDAICVR